VSASLGRPRLHLRETDSTNERARALAAAGAPHGTLVTAEEQDAGRGRQGRTWMAPAGRALLCSLIIRDPPRLLPLAAGVAVAETVDPVAVAETVDPVAVAEAVDPARAETVDPARADAVDPARAEPQHPRPQVKWPNDVLLDGRKLAGILVEGRPQERWAVLGVGVNVAVRPEDFPAELRERAATLGLGPEAIEPALERLLATAERWLAAPEERILAAVRARDALRGRPVTWADGDGVGDGIDDDGRLVVLTGSGQRVALDAGEIHLGG
jgi:BirA family biotin operon repressor/biotin-[acetyl-CoA-carboxylase] ligase